MIIGKAYQRTLREKFLDREPLRNEVLPQSRVVPLTYHEARSIILKYEWLGTMAGGTRACYGLKYGQEVLGVTCFDRHGCSSAAHDIVTVPAKTICLARGACVPHAPKNAGSYLIRHAIEQAHADFGWEVFFAYSDPSAGEIGTIYQALNWKYITASKDNGLKSFVSQDRAVKFSSYEFSKRKRTEYKFYRLGWDGVESKLAFLRRLGFEEKSEPTKGKYVWFEGDRGRQRYLRKHCRFPFLPYPKREQEAGA